MSMSDPNGSSSTLKDAKNERPAHLKTAFSRIRDLFGVRNGWFGPSGQVVADPSKDASRSKENHSPSKDTEDVLETDEFLSLDNSEDLHKQAEDGDSCGPTQAKQMRNSEDTYLGAQVSQGATENVFDNMSELSNAACEAHSPQHTGIVKGKLPPLSDPDVQKHSLKRPASDDVEVDVADQSAGMSLDRQFDSGSKPGSIEKLTADPPSFENNGKMAGYKRRCYRCNRTASDRTNMGRTRSLSEGDCKANEVPELGVVYSLCWNPNRQGSETFQLKRMLVQMGNDDDDRFADHMSTDDPSDGVSSEGSAVEDCGLSVSQEALRLAGSSDVSSGDGEMFESAIVGDEEHNVPIAITFEEVVMETGSQETAVAVPIVDNVDQAVVPTVDNVGQAVVPTVDNVGQAALPDESDVCSRNEDAEIADDEHEVTKTREGEPKEGDEFPERMEQAKPCVGAVGEVQLHQDREIGAAAEVMGVEVMPDQP